MGLKKASHLGTSLLQMKKKEKQAHTVAALTLGIPLILTSFYLINTKNTPVTLRRGCAYSALAAVNSLTSPCPVQVEDTTSSVFGSTLPLQVRIVLEQIYAGLKQPHNS